MAINETWEQTKARFKREHGISIEKELVPKVPQVRYDEPPPEPEVPRFNIHKRSLPVGIDEIVVHNVTKEEAKWWVDRRLKTKCYEDGARQTKTLIYYDVIPVDAKPKERSIFFNPRPVVTEGARYEEFTTPYPPEVDWK